MNAPSRLDTHFSSLIGLFLKHLRGVLHNWGCLARNMRKLRQGKGHMMYNLREINLNPKLRKGISGVKVLVQYFYVPMINWAEDVLTSSLIWAI
jgi:hypothetical protein